MAQNRTLRHTYVAFCMNEELLVSKDGKLLSVFQVTFNFVSYRL